MEPILPRDGELSQSIPAWATKQRALFDQASDAAVAFVSRFVRPDGTLYWRDRWPGMDGSDDAYEAFMHIPLLFALGGADELRDIGRRIWNGITWQWTEYGQIADEFDCYYDWMHHSEANLFLYFLPLADPDSLQDRQRAERFVAMYSGADDGRYSNFDARLGLMRSPLTGSRGPRFEVDAEDASTLRSLLDRYPAPFADLPGVTDSASRVRWTDAGMYIEILDRVNSRMTKGDVPINLFATTLFAHASMFSNDAGLVPWVTNYLDRWKVLTAKNGGILPDNVGPTGIIGENNDGKWWGGYYGWYWPHGLAVLMGPLVNAGAAATILTGDLSHLSLAREQIDLAHARHAFFDGERRIAHRHSDEGWGDYRPEDPATALGLWALSMEAEDLDRVERIPRTFDWSEQQFPRSGRIQHFLVGALPWFEYVRGRNPDYPVKALDANRELIDMQLSRMNDERNAPQRIASVARISEDGIDLTIDAYAIHVWQEISPIHIESLITLTTGGKAHSSWGGLQHSAVRHFDPQRMRAGLPLDLAVLVSEVSAGGITIEYANIGSVDTSVITQAGMYGEHRFTGVESLRDFPPARYLQVSVPAHSTLRIRLKTARFAATPSYSTPWSEGLAGPLISGREKS